jgi:hypothetical protein
LKNEEGAVDRKSLPLKNDKASLAIGMENNFPVDYAVFFW